jgi:phosphomannomutase
MINAAVIQAYDVRGIYPTELNDETVAALARAYAAWLKPKTVVLGRDVRESSPHLWQVAADALTAAGVNVIDIGVISTDMLYYAVPTLKADGGITVTASHNPREYNGMKMVREQAIPISSDSGLQEIASMLGDAVPAPAAVPGRVSKADIRAGYLEHVLSFIDKSSLKPLNVVINGNFGLAAQLIQEALTDSPIKFIPLNDQPDGTFPKGRPDPLIPENRTETEELVRRSKADLAIAWDADADRCFFFDEQGEFVDGYYMTTILAELMLKKSPGSAVIYDPRQIWAIEKRVAELGGRAVINKAGHTFIKEAMRREDAVFGGETSAHYYFRDNFYCDNGLIPALLVLEHLSQTGQKLSEVVRPLREQYFISGEVNTKVEDTLATLARVEQQFADGEITKIDGLSVAYPDWRFNVRASNTEPTIRLNVEAKSQALCDEKTAVILDIIKS